MALAGQQRSASHHLVHAGIVCRLLGCRGWQRRGWLRFQYRLTSPQESDRLYCLARTFALAAEVLGSSTKAKQWLVSLNWALAGEVPLQWLDNDIGSCQVEEVLLRLSYGVFN